MDMVYYYLKYLVGWMSKVVRITIIKKKSFEFVTERNNERKCYLNTNRNSTVDDQAKRHMKIVR